MPDRNPKTGRFMKRTVLRASNEGRNARGICAHKRTKLAKGSKRQNVPGFKPAPLRAYRPKEV